MTSYDVLLTLHVFAAIIWLGGAFMFFMLTLKASRSDDPMEAARVGESAEWLTPRLFIPSSLAVFVLGILLVLDGPWSFGDLWILIGLGGYAATFLVGILLISPTAKKLSEAAHEFGPTSPEAAALQRRVTIISRADLALLFVVAADMVIKPTTDDGFTVVLMAAAVVAAAVAAYLTAPPPVQAAPAPATD